MKAKNIAILLFSAVIGCTVAKTYSNLQEENVKSSAVKKERKANVKKNVKSETKIVKETETKSVQTEEIKSSSYSEYISTQRSGVIGVYGGNTIDNPEDNIFEVTIPSALSSNDKVVLSYDVEGLAGSAGVALSINDRTASGGMIAYSSDKVTRVSEEIDAAWLAKGKNRFMFALPDSANYGYKISNLKIAVKSDAAKGNVVATASAIDGQVYVKGFVKNAKAKSVNIAGKEYELTQGAFEALISGDDNTVSITCGNESKTLDVTTVPGCTVSTRLMCANKAEQQTQKEFSLAKKENNKVENVAATLVVDSGVAKQDMKITMTNLRHKDLPALDLGMTNVTDGVEGYRFLPHGTHFDGEGAVVSLKYDRTKIPSGYTENDIRTYYFDLDTKHWVALKRDSIDKENNLIVSRTNHFTDMINGVIQAPESPETQGFTPTMMSDLKLADPTAKIQSIEPPTANNRGSANLSYSFEMPPARNGMQPSLGIQYNSDGGTGLLGEGWDLSVPTISVETRWGVPRYSSNVESETYNMDGSMLVMENGKENYLAHRQNQIGRVKGSAVFHPRKENSFSKIVRLGDSPAEYTWVVTDKSGTKYYYGMKDADGNMKGVLMGKNYEGKDVIAEWKVVRIEEVHGDWIEYEYDLSEDQVSTQVTAKTLYLRKIKAGNEGEKAHTEVVINLGEKKRKPQRMGNYGFLVSNPYLLNSIDVNYEGKRLRSYEFGYNHKAPFMADLLEKIVHKNANGVEVSENKMQYHDNVSKNGISFGVSNSYSANSDDLYLFGPDQYGALGGVRMLGGTTSNTFSFNAYGGVGPNTESPIVKSLTVGGNFAYSHVTTHGVISFMDIDGDGLADKVYKTGKNKVCYRPYIPENNDYGNEVEIKEIHDISESTSSTITYGGNANAIGGITAGISSGNVDAETSIYFSDVNGDGLVDLVNGGSVLFNRLIEDDKKRNGNRKIAYFGESSDGTANPIVSSIEALKNMPQESKEEDAKRNEEKQKQKIENSPMQDVVRVWEAPYAGTVVVSGNPKYDGSKKTANSDGVAVSVQYKDMYLMNPVILKSDNASATYDKTTVEVEKGDKIYFRVQSGRTELANGEGDIVKWQPAVSYSDIKYKISDPNGLSLSDFSSKDGYLMSSSSEGLIDTSHQRPVRLIIDINKKETTDDVKMTISLHNGKTYIVKDAEGNSTSVVNEGYKIIDVLTYDFTADKTFSEDKTIDLNEYVYQNEAHPFMYISCRLESSTNIDWSKASLSARVEYEPISADDSNKPLGVPVFINMYANNDYFGGWKSEYGTQIEDETTYTVKESETEDKEKTIAKTDLIDKLELTPKINFEVKGALNIPAFRMAVKDESGKLLGNIKLNYADGAFSTIKVSDYPFFQKWFAQESPEKLWIEYYADLSGNIYASDEEKKEQASFSVKSSDLYVEAYEITVIEKKTTDEEGNEVTYNEEIKNIIYTGNISGLNVVSNRLDESFGPMYRGWGQFGYNAAKDRYKEKLDESRLGLSAYNDMAEGYDEEHPENFTYDRNEMAFLSLQPDFINGVWVGQATYRSGDGTITSGVGLESMTTARQGEQNVVVKDPFENIESQTVIGGRAIGFPVISESESTTKQGGALGVTKNQSEGSTKTTQSFMDMNGDGYPDLVKNSVIFYTSQLGGLNGGVKGFGFGLSDGGESAGTAYGAGNGAIHSFPSQLKQIINKNDKSNAQEKSAEKARAKVSFTGGFSSSSEFTTQSKVDMNGDGLLDIVNYVNGGIVVRLNLGYAFTEPIVWATNCYIRSCTSVDLSVGGSFDFSGSSISAGLNASGSSSNVMADLRDVNGDGLPDYVSNDKVLFNTGAGFEDGLSINGLSSLETSTSLNGTVNGNATCGFPVWLIRISISGGAALGKGLSGEEVSLQDFDGDGYPDVVTSDDKNEIKVSLSKIGATNKLKSVTTPFGGTYELEYTHSIPTQDHPGGKWVMSKLTVKDNIRDEKDCPPVVTEFDYDGGKHDRRERDFYGFAEVRTKRMNAENQVESQIVQNYDVTNYYSAGTAIGSYVCDANNKLFSKETTENRMFEVSGQGSVELASLVKENSRIFVAPVKTTSRRYENNVEDGVVTNIVENEYREFGNLVKYTYTDGIAQTSYTTNIKYKPIDKYGVFGLPTDVTVVSDGKTKRHVSAEYDDTGYNPGSMTSITQELGDESATTEFKYDTLGNIIEKIMPEVKTGDNLMKERMKYTYEYDKKYGMYPIRVTDGFGYRSDMFNYDYRYGIPLSVKDMNGFITEYEIDDLGRTTRVIAPNEMSAGKEYTIKNEYGVGGNLRMAKTYHYDPQHEDMPMITVNLVDGLGRVLQARKNAEVKGNSDVMIVSGKTVFDVLGREISHFSHTTCGKGDMDKLECKFGNDRIDFVEYDVFDRPMTKTLFDDDNILYETKIDYTIDDSKLATTIIDPEGMKVALYSDGTGHTLKTIKYHKNEAEAPAVTKFAFDGIGQLMTVTDDKGGVTTYEYDIAGRKLSVTHPSVGKISYTYDNLDNLLTKTMGKGDVVTYKYEYNRLVEQKNGDDKWKNKVTLTYGGVDAKHNRVGRLALVEDGSGAQEYFYGKMGEVEKIRRTIIIPGVDIATYTAEWKFDSWHRVQEMIYPDGEKIKYYYNMGGLLNKITGEKNYLYTYVDDIQYDEYEQRSLVKYGNGTTTEYKYENVLHRLDTMRVSNKDGLFLNNKYSYDKVNNVLGVKNSAALNVGIGGTMIHTYEYDDWHRLKTATGTFESADGQKRAEYKLDMGYDNLYNITSKKLTMSQTNLQFAGALSAGHEFIYRYSDDNPMQLASVMTKQYNVDRTNMDQNDIFDPEKELLKNIHTQNYEFDENGNMTSVYVASNDEQEVNNDQNPENQTPGEEQQASEETEGKDVLKSFLWDEENRLLAANNNGSVSCYFYDAAGERTVKLTSETEMVHVNGKKVGGNDNICKFTAYVSPYFVVSNGGAYTKHIYAANQRIASKLGNVDGFGADPRRVEMAGGKKISDFQKDKIGARFEELGFTYSAPEKEKVIPDSTVDSEEKESLVFYYHPDHLGSTSYVTDADGNIAQHVEYIPYGEIFVEERNNQFSTNYLFNAKELDNETGLYYYGARYLDPMGAMWLSVDPLFENYPGMSPYNYCKGNPVVLIDPDGLSDQSANLGGPCRRAPNGHNNIFYKAGKTLKNLFGKLHIYRPGYRKFQKIKKEPRPHAEPELKPQKRHNDFESEPQKRLKEPGEEKEQGGSHLRRRRWERITDGDGQIFSVIVNNGTIFRNQSIQDFKNQLDNYKYTIQTDWRIRNRYSGAIMVNLQVGNQLNLSDQEIARMEAWVNIFFRQKINPNARVTLNIQVMGNDSPPFAIYTEGLYRGAMTRDELREVTDE